MNKGEFLKSREDYIGLLMQANPIKLNIYIEGKDDYNFYYQFFKVSKPNLIRCFKKENVLKVANLYNRIGDCKSIFFVDRDFDENDKILNVFITDFYNFESHIFSRENISNYLESKHSINEIDIKKLCAFLNSQIVLNLFHSEYERIVLHDGQLDNKLIENQLNIIKIDKDYNFEPNNLFSKGIQPTLTSKTFDIVEMYNGKHIGNLFFGVISSKWFGEKFHQNLKIKDKKELIADMIINVETPEYVKKAKEFI